MKKFSPGRLYLLPVLLLISIIHLPFAFSVSNGMGMARHTFNHHSKNISSSVKTDAMLTVLYDSLQLSAAGLSEEAFDYAIKGYAYLKDNGKLKNERVISIIDFTKPSYQKRLFILDVEDFKLLFNTYVAHGQNTGKVFANKFSNISESHQSSLGFYTTTDTYYGKNGFSLQLEGQEYGINHKAEARAIVIHGAPYVSEGFIRSQGYIGRSYGCPALPENLNKPIINTIKNGTCLFIYSNDRNYLQKSRILNT